MKIFWYIAGAVATVLVLLFFLFSSWELSVEITANNLENIHISVFVDEKNIGNIVESGILTTKVKNGEHSLSVKINGKTILRKDFSLPIFSLTKKKILTIEMPPIGYVDANCSENRGHIVYEGPYPIDKWKLKIGDKYLKINHKSFECNFSTAYAKAVLYGYIGNSKIIEKEVFLKRNTINAIIEPKGSLKVIKHVTLFFDNQPIKQRQSIKVIPGEHKIIAKIKDTVVSSKVLLMDRDSVYTIDIPDLSKISSSTLKVVGTSVKIFWTTEKNGLEPEDYLIESSFGEKAKRKTYSATFPYHESTVVYTITPLYFGETIKGSAVSLIKPSPPKIDVEGISNISSSCRIKPIIKSNGKLEIYMNEEKVKSKELILNEGENLLKIIATDDIGQTSVVEKRVICDKTPPKISFEIKSKLFKIATSEPATVLVNGREQLQVNRWLPVYDLPASFTLAAIDRALNKSEKPVFLLKKPKILTKLISPNKVVISIEYNYPYDYFIVDIDGNEYQISSTSTTIPIPIKKSLKVSIASVYKNIVGPKETIKVENHYIKGKIISGKLESLEEGYYTVSGNLILSDLKASSDATFLIAENSTVLLKGQIAGNGRITFAPLYKEWKGILFEGENLSGIKIYGAKVGIKLLKDANLKDITIEDSDVGILMSNGSFTVDNTVIKNSKTSLISYGSKLYIRNIKFENFNVAINLFNSFANIKKSVFEGSGTGINSQNSYATISSSILKGNKEGIKSIGSTMLIISSKFINNDTGIKTVSSTLMVESSEFLKNKKAIYLYRQRKDCSVHNSIFKDNELDIFLMGTENIRIVPLSSVKKFIDGSVQSTWIDDRGKIKKRGRIVGDEQ